MLTREYTSVAALIVTERNAKGWTQKELADRIGLSNALVGRWETGDVPITRRNAELVAEALDINKEILVMKAFVEQMAEFRRRNQRTFEREYAGYPQVLRLVESMRNCPNCSDVNRELERISSIDMKFLELALDSLGAGFYISDVAGNILYTNEYLAKMLRTDKESLLGQAIQSFSADPERSERLKEQLLTTGSCTGKAGFVRQDNTVESCVFWCYTIKNAHGNPIGVIAIIHTLDACKEIVDQLFEEASTTFDVAKSID